VSLAGPNTYSILDIIGSVASGAAFIALAVEVGIQVRELRNARVSRLTDDLVKQEVREAVQRIYQCWPSDLRLQPLRSETNDSLRKDVENVIGLFNSIGYRVRSKVLSRPLVLRLYWDTIIRIAQQLHDYIADQRRSRGEPLEGHTGSSYCADLEWLALGARRA
jgi:hypothetical protein